MGVGGSSISPKAIIPVNTALSGGSGGNIAPNDSIITEDNLYFITEDNDYIVLE